MPEKCPIANNTCEITNPEASACGRDSDHFPPQIIAEFMCTRALAGRIELEIEEMGEVNSPAKLAAKYNTVAAFELELGLADPDVASAALHMDKAQEYADDAMHQRYSWFRTTYSAALLHLYGPLLIARKDSLPSLEELQRTRQGLGIIYDSLRTVPVHVPQLQHITDAFVEGKPHHPCLAEEGERQGLMAKVVGQMFAARQNILLYAAMDREAHASGNWTALNHDAYKLDERGEKTLVKFRAKGKHLTNTDRGMNYDDTVIYINMRALINRVADDMRGGSREHYRSLLETHNDKWPDIVGVGRMLRTEIHGVKNISSAEKALLDAVAAEIEKLLLTGEDDPAKIREDTAAGRQPESPNQSAQEEAWEILPAEVIESHENRRTYNDPMRLKRARSALNAYALCGHGAVDAQRLEQLIDSMRQTTDPRIVSYCIGAYIDLARNPQTRPDAAVRLIEASEILAGFLTAKDWRNLEPHEIEARHYVDMQSAYASKYKKTLTGEVFSLDDETKLYLRLLAVGDRTLEPAAYHFDSRGIQFEIGLHILNARLNLKNRQFTQAMWPSLPRERIPYDFNFTFSTARSATVTRGNFIDQGPWCKYIQCKSVDTGKAYDPDITVMIAKDDFGMATSADIILYALSEARNPGRPSAAQAKLDRYEQIFLNKLGFS